MIYEVCEQKINSSSVFFYLRLHLIKIYFDKQSKHGLKTLRNSAADTATSEVYQSPLTTSNEYKKFIFGFTNALEII